MSLSGSVSSTPFTTTLPELGCSNRFTHRNSVDFPDPDGPIMQLTSPRRTRKSIPSSTRSEPNDFRRPVTSTITSLIATDLRGGVFFPLAATFEILRKVTERDRDHQITQSRQENRRQRASGVQALPAELGELVLVSGEPEQVDQ